MSNELKEEDTVNLLTKLLTKHDKVIEKQDDKIIENNEAINLLKEGQTKILESLESLQKAVSEHTSQNPVGPSPGIPGDKGNAGKKEDAPNALAPDEKDPASGSDPPSSDKAGLSGETKKADDEKEEKKEEVEKDHMEGYKDEKKEDKEVEKTEDKEEEKEDEKKMEKGKILPGKYRTTVEKTNDTADVLSGSYILKTMTGEGFKADVVTPQIVKSRLCAEITKHFIRTQGNNDGILKNYPTGGNY